MPLEILGPLVLIGIISAVIFVRFVANTPPRLIEDHAQAKAVFLKDFPAVTFGPMVAITKNEREALIEIKEPVGHIGFVHAMGSKHVARLIAVGDIASISEKDGTRLILNLGELTLPQIVFDFQTEERCKVAMSLFDEIKLPINA